MLDDDAGRRVERLHAFPRGIGVGDVVVRQFLALELAIVRQRAFRRDDVAIERGALMRVLAVAHVLHLRVREIQRGRVGGALGVTQRLAQAREVVRDRAVVLGRVSEHLRGQTEVRGVADRVAVRLHFVEHHGVVGRIDDHGDVAMVLRSRAQHRRAADVDVLDGVFERAVIARDGLHERVQVHHE